MTARQEPARLKLAPALAERAPITFDQLADASQYISTLLSGVPMSKWSECLTAMEAARSRFVDPALEAFSGRATRTQYQQVRDLLYEAIRRAYPEPSTGGKRP